MRFEAGRNQKVAFLLANLHNTGHGADCWKPIDRGKHVSLRHLLFLGLELLVFGAIWGHYSLPFFHWGLLVLNCLGRLQVEKMLIQVVWANEHQVLIWVFRSCLENRGRLWIQDWSDRKARGNQLVWRLRRRLQKFDWYQVDSRNIQVSLIEPEMDYKFLLIFHYDHESIIGHGHKPGTPIEPVLLRPFVFLVHRRRNNFWSRRWRRNLLT